MTENTKEGIYFNMPEEEYHALPCLSRSGMEDIYIDVEEFWYKSWMNPDRPKQNPTEAMKLGTAIHSAILEPDVFDELYCKFPSVEDFEDKTILKTSEDLKNFLDNFGEKKIGKKEDLIERALPYIDPEKFVIWDIIQKKFLESTNNNGKRSLSLENSETIEGIQQAIERRPNIKKIFSKGYPEVTIIWKDEETGVMCKCRLDYVRPELIGELKSFSLKGKKSVHGACCDEIIHQKYNLQYYIYSKALEIIIKKIRLGEAEVYGQVDKEWLQKFLEHPRKQFFILFVRTTAPFQALAIELIKNMGGEAENSYYLEPQYWCRTAIKKVKKMHQEFGDKRWIEEDYIKELQDDSMGFLYQFKQ